MCSALDGRLTYSGAQVIATAVQMARKRARSPEFRVLFVTKAPTLVSSGVDENVNTAEDTNAPRWLWKRQGSSGAAALERRSSGHVPGGLFSSSPRRISSAAAIDMRADHASAKKARLLAATSNMLKGVQEGRKARLRITRMRRLERAAGKRLSLRNMLKSADVRRAALAADKLAAIHAHLSAVQTKRALVKAARIGAMPAPTAVAC